MSPEKIYAEIVLLEETLLQNAVYDYIGEVSARNIWHDFTQGREEDLSRIVKNTSHRPEHFFSQTGRKTGPLVRTQGVPCFNILCAELAELLKRPKPGGKKIKKRSSLYKDIAAILQLLGAVWLPKRKDGSAYQDGKDFLSRLRVCANEGRLWLAKHHDNKRLIECLIVDSTRISLYSSEYIRPKEKVRI